MLPRSITKLFWDVDTATLDIEKNERLIVSRLLNYGTLEGWRWLVRTYGKARVAAWLHSGTRLGVRPSARRLAELLFM